MNCREFRAKHVGFIDDVLSAADMSEMRRHVGLCSRCSTLDVRIRRSLLVVRNLPQIQPSPDFFARLNDQLKNAPVPARAVSYRGPAATFFAVTAALAAAVYFAMAAGGSSPQNPAQPAVAAAPVAESAPDAAMAMSVPTGVPVWPAMFMVGELPMHLASAELLDSGIGR